MENIIQEMSNMSIEHRLVMQNLNYLFDFFFRENQSNYLVLREAKYQWDGIEGRYEPDISVLNKNPRRKSVYYTDVPIFIAEILSPSTKEYDCTDKKNIYLTVGVSEYWLVDYQSPGGLVERYILNDDGDNYILYDKVIGMDSTLNTLTIPGLCFKVKDLYYNM